jgi:membrane protease YdiL (CAAX protease family)
MKEICDLQAGRLLTIIVLLYFSLNAIIPMIFGESVLFRYALPWIFVWPIIIVARGKFCITASLIVQPPRSYWYALAIIAGIFTQPIYLSTSIFDVALSKCLVAAMAAIVVAYSEEFTFRGLAYNTIKGRTILKILFSAAIFSAAHWASLSLSYLLVVFIAGILLGALRSSSRSILPGVLVHFLHNLGTYAVF